MDCVYMASIVLKIIVLALLLAMFLNDDNSFPQDVPLRDVPTPSTTEV